MSHLPLTLNQTDAFLEFRTEREARLSVLFSTVNDAASVSGHPHCLSHSPDFF